MNRLIKLLKQLWDIEGTIVKVYKWIRYSACWHCNQRKPTHRRSFFGIYCDECWTKLSGYGID